MTPEQLNVLSLAKNYADAMENCTQSVVDQHERNLLEYVDSLLAAERAAVVEECAKVCDESAAGWIDVVRNVILELAAAIRKLGEKHE